MTAARTFLRLQPAELDAWLAARPQALRLDARQAADHAAGHLEGALRLDGRNHEALLLRTERSRPVLVSCYRGEASQTYAQMFVDFGFREVADLVGGWTALVAWRTAQLAGAVPASPPVASPDAPLARWLAEHGFADAHGAVGPHRNTPLMHAAWRGEAAVVEALLAQGASLAATNGDGNTALWLACVAAGRSGETTVLRRLVAAGADIDHANLTGATCLMYGASAGKPLVVRTLLELGADPLRRSQDDFSALDMAADLDSLRLLRAATRAAPASTALPAPALSAPVSPAPEARA